MTKNLYVAKSDAKLVERLERLLKQRNESLSAWFIRRCEEEVTKADGKAK